MDLRFLPPHLIAIIDYLFLMASVIPVVYASYRYFKKYQPSEENTKFVCSIVCVLIFIAMIVGLISGIAWLFLYSYLAVAYTFFVVGTYFYCKYSDEPTDLFSQISSWLVISIYIGGGLILLAMEVGFIYQQGLIY